MGYNWQCLLWQKEEVLMFLTENRIMKMHAIIFGEKCTAITTIIIASISTAHGAVIVGE